jgi:hypothetical protein
VSEQEVHAGVPAWIPSPPTRQLRVWTHVLNEVEPFDDAVAIMSPNGALTVWRWGSDAKRGDVPIKGYAPGSWITYTHVGDGYRTPGFRELTQDTAEQRAAKITAKARTFTDRYGTDALTNLSQRLSDGSTRAMPETPDEPELADPFRELSPESLDQQHDGLDAGNRQGEIHPIKAAQPDEDGDDAAFRQSGDDVPFDDPETAGSRGDTVRRGVAQVVGAARPIVDQFRKWWGWLARRSWDLHTAPLLRPLPPRWWDCDPLLMGAVLTLSPVVVYLSLAS